MLRNPRLRRLVIIVALGCIATPIPADDVQSGYDGQQIVPVDSEAIRMASERVDVDVDWSDAAIPRTRNGTEMHVKALFVLVNETDQPQSILVSFPGAFNVTGLTRTVDDRPVKVEEHRRAEYGNASKIDFAPRQTRRVRVEYSGDSSACSDGSAWWCYILTTGARWKGNIGEAVVAIHFPTDMPPGGKGPFNFDAITMTPAGFETQGRTAIWTFSDFKPSEDISLKWTRYSALVASDPFQLVSKQEASGLLLAQGQQMELRKALGAFAAIREFFPESDEAKTLDYHVANALAQESRYRKLNSLYVKEAIARYEAALKQPIDAEQQETAMCEQFILCCVEARDDRMARRLLDRLKKEKLESKAAAALKAWGKDGIIFGHPQEAIRAFEAIRKSFPDSSEAKTIDYDVAVAYAYHRVSRQQANGLTVERAVTDARKAVAHYEAALKQPLDPLPRQRALTELFFLYSCEAPNPTKAQKTYDLLKGETIDPREYGIFMKVAAVSPDRALALVDSTLAVPELADTIANLRGEMQQLLHAYPEGAVNR